MARIVYLENGSVSTRLWYCYYDGDYQVVDVTGKTKAQAIASLPTPTPNFVQQLARNRDEAIQLVKDMQAQDLLASPV